MVSFEDPLALLEEGFIFPPYFQKATQNTFYRIRAKIIEGGEITGSTIQTATSGKRIVIKPDFAGLSTIKFYTGHDDENLPGVVESTLVGTGGGSAEERPSLYLLSPDNGAGNGMAAIFAFGEDANGVYEPRLKLQGDHTSLFALHVERLKFHFGLYNSPDESDRDDKFTVDHLGNVTCSGAVSGGFIELVSTTDGGRVQNKAGSAYLNLIRSGTTDIAELRANDRVDMTSETGDLRFLAGGNVRFQIYNSEDIRFWNSNGSNVIMHYDDSQSEWNWLDSHFRISNGDHWSRFLYPITDDTYDIGASSFRWQNIWATDTTINNSDESTKVNIADADLGLDFIRDLRPIRFQRQDGVRPHYGFGAQQVKEVMDARGVDFAGYIDPAVGAIEPDPDGDYEAPYTYEYALDLYERQIAAPKGLRMAEFIGPIVAAVQELADRVEQLENA